MFKYAEYIYKIYQEGSFTQAAKKLFISQPALSATVKKAEEELGFRIFNRNTSPLSTTDAGAEYIAAIEQIAAIKRNLKNRVENIYALTVGDVSVGGAAFISSFIIPKIAMEFSKLHPKIEIFFTESDSASLKEKLLAEEIDILIDYDFDPNVFELSVLKTERILLAVPKHHPINQKFSEKQLSVADIKAGRHFNSAKGIGLEGFKSEKFIQLKTGNSMYNYSRALCNEYGFSPENAIYVDQLLTAYNIAASGMGLTFTTDTVVTSAADSGSLVFYLPESANAQRQLVVAHKSKKYLSPAVEEFIRIATKLYK